MTILSYVYFYQLYIVVLKYYFIFIYHFYFIYLCYFLFHFIADQNSISIRKRLWLKEKKLLQYDRHGSHGQGKSGNFKKSGKVMESQGKLERVSEGILKVPHCKNQNLLKIIKT